MSKHEEGPWMVGDLSGKYYGTRVFIGSGEILIWDHMSEWSPPSVRELPAGKAWDDLDRQEQWDITCDSHYENERDYATACLIAEAPTMFELLEAMADDGHKGRFDYDKWVAAARASLARARGEGVS